MTFSAISGLKTSRWTSSLPPCANGGAMQRLSRYMKTDRSGYGSRDTPRALKPSTVETMKRNCAKGLSYSVFYEQSADGGYVAFVPTLPGCHTQGETPEEA